MYDIHTEPDSSAPIKHYETLESGPILQDSSQTEELTTRSTAIAIAIDIVSNAGEVNCVLHLSCLLLSRLRLTNRRLCYLCRCLICAADWIHHGGKRGPLSSSMPYRHLPARNSLALRVSNIPSW
jgi:hypothetical protein